jgi:hypothetical protein
MSFFYYLNIWGSSPYWVHSAPRPLLACCTCPGWLWGWISWWNKRFWQWRPKYSEKTCLDAILSTTNPTCQTRTRTRAAAVGSQQLTASATAWPTTWAYSGCTEELHNFLSQMASLLACIREFPSSILGLNVDYSDIFFVVFPIAFRQISSLYRTLNVPLPSFTIHFSYYRIVRHRVTLVI